MMHRVALLEAEVSSLRKANEALSKCRRAKKTQVHQGGSLTTRDVQDLLDQKAVDEQLQQETRESGGRSRRARAKERHCGTCSKTGHNARTCQKDVEMSDV